MIILALSTLLYLTISIPAVRAQTTSATCRKNETTSFLFNANDESPCLVWAKFQSLCLTPDRYINVPALSDRTWGYNPPGKDGGLCQCSVVSYALMAGCSWCQLGDTASWVSEERWRADCSAYNNTSVSFAQSVLPIPVYAFHPWSGSRWTASEALSAASGPSTLVPTIGTTTLLRSFTDSRSTATSSLTPTNSAPPDEAEDGGGPFDGASGKAARWGAIVGGIVGGVLLLVLLVLLFRHWRRKHRFDKNASEGESGEYGIRGKGEPFGLPMYDSPDTPTTTASGGFFRFGKRQPPCPIGNTGKRDQSRVSQWSSNFFTNPRKAPQPDSAIVTGAGYKTTTQRLREKGRYSSSDESSIDVRLHGAHLTSRMSQAGWDKRDDRRDTFATQSTFDQSRENSVQIPQSARHPFALSPGRDPTTPTLVPASKTRRESQKTSPRKPVPIAPQLRESLRPDTWSDQSSVMTFATGKTGYTTGGTGGSLPSFSTSIKEIKNHRQALAAKVAETEQKERERELGYAEQEQEGAKSGKKDKRSTKSGREKKSKSKSKSGKRGSKVIVSGEIGLDEILKKKKSKKKTKSVLKQTSPLDPSNKKLSPITYPRQSHYTAHTSDLPDLVSKPLPTPPTGTLAPPIRQNSDRRQDISIDFSLAPLSATSPYTRGSVIDHNAQNAGRILSDMIPSGQNTTWYSRGTAYPSRHTSMMTTSVPYGSGGGRGGNGDRATMDFTRPRPTPDSPHSPRSTLPSLYEPFTGAPRYDVPPLPPKRGQEGDLVSPLSKYPMTRIGNRI